MGTDDVCNERGQSNGALLQQLGNTMVYQGVASLPSTSTLTVSLGHRRGALKLATFSQPTMYTSLILVKRTYASDRLISIGSTAVFVQPCLSFPFRCVA